MLLQQKYQRRVDSFRQNRLFENNQRQFYREFNQEEERCDDDQPVPEESKQFWGIIWNRSADHKKEAKWLQEKCAMLVIKKEKIVKSVGIELPDGRVIKSLQEGES